MLLKRVSPDDPAKFADSCCPPHYSHGNSCAKPGWDRGIFMSKGCIASPALDTCGESESDKKNYAGDAINQKRIAIAKHRIRLQKKGTRSAKRRLKKISGKEKRFQKVVSHNISKEIVAEAKGTGRGVALEDLSSINQGTVVRKRQRYIRLSWAFYLLRSYIEYKAGVSGVPIRIVDPRNTSRECPECHSIDRRNRKDRDTFKCVQCGNSGEADYVASLNIRNRAAVNQPIVAGAIFGHFDPPVTSQRASAVGS